MTREFYAVGYPANLLLAILFTYALTHINNTRIKCQSDLTSPTPHFKLIHFINYMSRLYDKTQKNTILLCSRAARLPDTKQIDQRFIFTFVNLL